jgi:hypothetical protein
MMSEINDQSSNTNSHINWSFDHLLKGQQEQDRVIFENVQDQYVKGEDVTVFFSIFHGTKINSNEDQIGLIRVH